MAWNHLFAFCAISCVACGLRRPPVPQPVHFLHLPLSVCFLAIFLHYHLRSHLRFCPGANTPQAWQDSRPERRCVSGVMWRPVASMVCGAMWRYVAARRSVAQCGVWRPVLRHVRFCSGESDNPPERLFWAYVPFFLSHSLGMLEYYYYGAVVCGWLLIASVLSLDFGS